MNIRQLIKRLEAMDPETVVLLADRVDTYHCRPASFLQVGTWDRKVGCVTPSTGGPEPGATRRDNHRRAVVIYPG